MQQAVVVLRRGGVAQRVGHFDRLQAIAVVEVAAAVLLLGLRRSKYLPVWPPSCVKRPSHARCCVASYARPEAARLGGNGLPTRPPT